MDVRQAHVASEWADHYRMMEQQLRLMADKTPNPGLTRACADAMSDMLNTIGVLAVRVVQLEQQKQEA